MINSISSANGHQFSMRSSNLTDDQKNQIESVLSKYDSENITNEDKQKLKDELKSLNVGPSKELFEILKSAGFGPNEMKGKEAEGLPPMPGNASGEAPTFMQDFMEKQKAGTVTQDDLDTLIKNLQGSGQNITGWFVDKAS